MTAAQETALRDLMDMRARRNELVDSWEYALLRCLSLGISIRTVAKASGVSARTVQRIAERES